MLKRLLSKTEPASPRQLSNESQPDRTLLRPKPERAGRAWIGVDLDGTLAEFTKWRGLEHIGKPIPLMKERVVEWINAGYNIKIFTARAATPEGAKIVQDWLKQNGLPILEVTDKKDFDMIEYWDDRAVQVISNTGKFLMSASILHRPKAPLLSIESRDTVQQSSPPGRSQ